MDQLVSIHFKSYKSKISKTNKNLNYIIEFKITNYRKCENTIFKKNIYGNQKKRIVIDLLLW